MTDMNHHFRNMHLQNLVDENEELRRRITKLTQIEGYVELLVDKLEKADAKEKAFSSENTVLRQQIRELEIKYANVENMHGDEMRYVFGQHDQILQEKNTAISQLKALLDQQNSRGSQLQAEFRFQKTNEQKLVGQYQQALMKYRNRVNQLEQDLQVIYQSLQEEKIMHTKTKDTWIAEANQFKNSLKDKELQNGRLRDEINKLLANIEQLQTEVKNLVGYNEQIEAKLRNTEEQSSRLISKLKQALAQVEQALLVTRQERDNLLQSKQSLLITKQSLLKEISSLGSTIASLKQDNGIYVTDNQRLIFLLQESDKQNLHLREKHEELEDYSGLEIQKLKTQNLRLREQYGVVSKNSSEREMFIGTKLIELKEANAARNSLEIYMEQSQEEILALRAELEETQAGLLNEKNLSTELDLQRKKISESAKLLKQENANIQSMIKKIQRQNLQLSNQNHNLTRLLSNPREKTREYAEQVDKIVKNFHAEREEQNQRHAMEKEKIKQMYDYEIRQKEMELMRQISSLQEEIAKATRIDILIQRGSNNKTMTPANGPFRTPLKR